MKFSEEMSCCMRERSQHIGWSNDLIKADILLAPGLVTSQLELLEKAAGLHMCSKMFSENLIWLTGAERKEKKQKQELSRRGPGVWRTAKGAIWLYGYRKTFVGQKTWLTEDGQSKNKSLSESISQQREHCVCWDDRITPFKHSKFMWMNRILPVSGRKCAERTSLIVQGIISSFIIIVHLICICFSVTLAMEKNKLHS